MQRKEYTEEQNRQVLKECEAGTILKVEGDRIRLVE